MNRIGIIGVLAIAGWCVVLGGGVVLWQVWRLVL